MNKIRTFIPLLFIWILSVFCAHMSAQSDSNSISFFKERKNHKPITPPEQSNSNLRFGGIDIVGCWSALSEIGTDGEDEINTVFPENVHYVWFNSDGSYYQSEGGVFGIYRRWWISSPSSFRDSDGFIMEVISYENDVLVLRCRNTDYKDYLTLVTMKRSDKISLNIGKGYGYLKYNDGRHLKGAVADGETQLRIDVKSIVHNYASYKIELESTLGKDESTCGKIGELFKTGNGTASFTYTVPEEFPDISYNKYYVKLHLSLYDHNGVELTDGELLIEIIRPPVLLVHGLNDNDSCFSNFDKYLQKSYLYNSFQIFRIDYSLSNKSSFATNANVVENGLIHLFEECRQAGYIGSKADIIGHSMGGLLSRYYLQNKSHNGVNRLITLNTPHWGSQGANLIIDDIYPYCFQKLANLGIVFGQWDAPAIKDLMVGSNAIKQLTNSSSNLKGIPIHTISTDYTGDGAEITIFKILLDLIKINKNVKDFSLEKLTKLIYHGESDWVVSLRSQKGGLSGASTSVLSEDNSSYIHIYTPRSEEIHKLIFSLLNSRDNNRYFTSNGLVPTPEPGLSKEDIRKIYEEIFYTVPEEKITTPVLKSSSASISINNCEIDQDRMLNVTCENTSEIISHYLIVSIGDDNIITEKDADNIKHLIPKDFGGTIQVYALGVTNSGELFSDKAELNISKVLGEDDYVEFENPDDTLIIFKGESIAPQLKLYRNYDFEYVSPDSYQLPDMFGPNDAAEIRDGRVYGAKEGTGMLVAFYDIDGDIIPYKVIDANKLMESDEEEPSALEYPSLYSGKTNNFIEFYYSEGNKSAILKIKGETTLPIQYLIYTMDGKLLKKEEIHSSGQHKLSLNRLKQGTYIAVFLSGNQKESFKFITR